MSHHKGHTGTSLGGKTEVTPRKRRAKDRARRAEEKRWAALAGPVTVRKAEDDRPAP